MNDVLWSLVVLVIVVGACFVIFHAKIAAFFAEVHAKLDMMHSQHTVGLKQDLAEVKVLAQSLQDLFITHHNALAPEINTIVAAVTKPTPPPRAISTDAPPTTQPITAQEYATLCLKASVGSGGYVCGANWSQIEYLRALSPYAFADFCAQLAALPECKADPSTNQSATAGWIQNLSQQGQGIILTLDGKGLPIPAVDPRPTHA